MIETTRLGRSGLAVSRLALGTAGFAGWIGVREAGRLLRHAVEGGISLVDTAHAYEGSESIIGDALDRELRGACTIATKISTNGLGTAADILSVLDLQITASLRDLKTERLDLMQLHEPAPERQREPIQRLLERRLQDGAIGWVGLCNHSAADLQAFMQSAPAIVRHRLVSLQNQLSLIAPNALASDLPAARSHGLAFMAWSPLGGGLLAHARRTTPRLWMPWEEEALTQAYDAGDAARLAAAKAGRNGIAQALDFVWSAAPDSIAIVGPRDVAQLETILQLSQRRPRTAI